MMEQLFPADKDEKTPGMYDPAYEHDNCGIGVVVNIDGVPSNKTVDQALHIVETLEHRAGKDAEGKTGDGVGIIMQISHKFFKKAARECGITLGGEREYGVGMFFFSQEQLDRVRAKKMFEIIAGKEGLKILGWRTVPVDDSVIGTKAHESMPCIEQCFIAKPEGIEKGIDFDRKLYIVRRLFEQSNESTYVCSLSSRTIVYKGMFLVKELRKFYLDLQDTDYESAIAVVHSRFSTNTNPSWELAHPFRYIVHNGEINTIRGNVDKMISREETLKSSVLGSDIAKVLPVINEGNSDSAMLDNALEFLTMAGMDLPLAVMITIPAPWEHDKAMPQEVKDFYRYYATMMEPWDGPASILFTDGDLVGAVLDRNGLRPSRYYITDDNMLILASEVGSIDIDQKHVVKKERLHPGKMLLVDTREKRIISDEEIKMKYATEHPYGEWLDNNLVNFDDLPIPNKATPPMDRDLRAKLWKTYNYTYEEYRTMIMPMARDGAEPASAMGCDTPLAVLSEEHQPLFNYFKQQFAQVTNPPIDSIREEVVTSTTVYMGPNGNILEPAPESCHIIRVDNPILSETDLLKIKSMKVPGFNVVTVPITYYKSTSLEKALDRLFVTVDRAYNDGKNVIILSDRDIDESHVPIPSLLAVAALNSHLVRTHKRTQCAVILESGEPREVHHFATLLGYGATAICPYLAQESIRYLIDCNMLDKDYYAAVNDYNSAVLHGIIKIASKMGISTINSYRGSQIFEAVGLADDVIKNYFPHTSSRVGGVTLDDIARDVNYLHTSAFDPLGLTFDPTLESVGSYKERAGREQHLYNPRTIHMLQDAVWSGDYEKFKQYSEVLHEDDMVVNLRSLLDFKFDENGGIPIDEVESVDSIVTRFKTGAMSFGSISKEAHECMAVAMNSIGAKSNTGEGGEDVARFTVGPDGLDKNSKIKQVASGRFGVTSRYLVSATDIQIKMCQGAKPGEGGQLPGKKVYPWVAATRNSTTGVGLISPPPHHDIYSIEDLAQLIYDLKCANDKASISVKLCSEAGVGTVASGVAKGGAQTVVVCGYEGGTGSAPRNSIFNAGVPWELGVSETHQTLIKNGLRDRVILETDGKLMDGRDVAIACMLGAEEFAFGTAALVCMGCVMMRACNLDTCPVGIATQNPELRKRFKGKPEYIVNFMKFTAEELREYMAKLGIRTVDELVGHTDLLKVKDNLPSARAAEVDFSKILDTTYAGMKLAKRSEKDLFNFDLENSIDKKVLIKKLGDAVKKGTKKSIEVDISNVDRTLGTQLGAEITRAHPEGLPEDTITVKCNGSGGQSFGAFIPSGLTLELEGDSNDYFGKGLSGGKLIVYPPKVATFAPEENVIIGNVALYGATGGKAFINGVAGERFCVRNSGATAVVEGVGDHGCEYMTGGRVVVLGPVGINFAAGMSGGVAYVLDEDNQFYKHLNKEMVSYGSVTGKYDVQELKEILTEHVMATNSPKAKHILDHFSEYLPKFKMIMPNDYEKMTNLIVEMEEKGLNSDQAQMEAFYAISGN